MIQLPNQQALAVQLWQAKSYVTGLARGLPDGDDLFQIVSQKCFEKCSDRDWQQPQRDFICRVAHTTLCDLHRRKRVRSSLWTQSEYLEPAEDHDEPLTAMLRSECVDCLRRTMRQLAEPYRSVILARYFEGMVPTEIATAHEKSINTVKSQLKRGLAMLRSDEDLKQYFCHEVLH